MPRVARSEDKSLEPLSRLAPRAIVAVLFESGVDFFEGFVTEVGDAQQGLRAGL
jgi:hypothetical protein